MRGLPEPRKPGDPPLIAPPYENGFSAELARGWRAQDELKRLRLSLVRVAQALDIEGYALLDDPENAAQSEERGWNALAAECVHRAQRLTRDISVLRAGLGEHVHQPASQPAGQGTIELEQ